ncbi:MAG: hypothetical protein R3B09_20045 [Nannocystaceae bacterium]
MVRAHGYHFEARVGYLLVVQEGRVGSVAEAAAFQRAVDEAMIGHGGRRVLLDNRATERPDEEVRASMWTWVTECTHFDRFALLLEGERTSQRANLTASRNRAAVVAFTDEAEALAWLLE